MCPTYVSLENFSSLILHLFDGLSKLGNCTNLESLSVTFTYAEHGNDKIFLEEAISNAASLPKLTSLRTNGGTQNDFGKWTQLKSLAVSTSDDSSIIH